MCPVEMVKMALVIEYEGDEITGTHAHVKFTAPDGKVTICRGESHSKDVDNALLDAAVAALRQLGRVRRSEAERVKLERTRDGG